jgi:hypothetical protein
MTATVVAALESKVQFKVYNRL